MISTIKILDFGYLPDPNITDLTDSIIMDQENLLVEFPLNYHINPELTRSSTGRLTFKGVKKYIYGQPNDEGFDINYKDKFDYPALGFEMNQLYEVINLKNEFAEGSYELLRDSSNKHYIFFVKEGTFQCIAQNWEFVLLNS